MNEPVEVARPGVDELEALVAEALEALAAGLPLDLAARTAGRPRLRADVEAALTVARRISALDTGAFVRPRAPRRPFAGRYSLGARIDVGPCGILHEGHDAQAGRAVAIELLREDLLETPAARARFLADMRALAAVDHPHVAKVCDAGEAPTGEVFVVRELLEGRTLRELLDELEFEPDDADHQWLRARIGVEGDLARDTAWVVTRWAADLAAGLAAAHAAGCVHRDVRPDHVLLTRDARAVLTGFGAEPARGERDDDAPWADSSRHYRAPELRDPEHARGVAQDVYGLAATLLHLLTRRCPSEPNAARGWFRRRPEGSVPSDVPIPALAAVVARGMARDRRERYPAMVDFERDLRAVLARWDEHRGDVRAPGRGFGAWCARLLAHVRAN